MTAPSGRVLAFVSVLGGVGQTTAVANFAHLLARRGDSVLTIELCTQNLLARHLGQTETLSAGWAALMAADQWWGEAALANDTGVRCLPFGPITPSQGDALHWRMRTQPHWLREQIDQLCLPEATWVLLDAPVWPTPLARQALHAADHAVVMLEASPRGLEAQARIQALAPDPAEHRRAAPHLMVGRYDTRRPTQRRCLHELRALWGDALAPHVIHEDESNPAALAESTCVTAFASQAQSAHDLHGVLQWLMTRTSTADEVAA
jgi:cellulose synthase operon protein YhjQ